MTFALSIPTASSSRRLLLPLILTLMLFLTIHSSCSAAASLGYSPLARQSENCIVRLKHSPFRDLAAQPRKFSQVTFTAAAVGRSTAATEASSGGGWLRKLASAVRLVWDFSRPHTIVGSALSTASVYMYALPMSMWLSAATIKSFLFSFVPSLLMNIYITGLNQVTDVDIDYINKPFLPLPSGRLSRQSAIALILSCLSISSGFAYFADWPLRATLLGSGLLGTLYSLPPFRFKRSSLLAALCIVLVRGPVINMGFFLQAKRLLGDLTGPSVREIFANHPDAVATSLFFATFGAVIALLKDAPDVHGDEKHNIRTLSVMIGPQRVLWLTTTLLFSLLAGSGAYLIGTAEDAALPSGRLGAGSTAIALAANMLLRARATVPSAQGIYSFYMHVWKIFYACYLLLPFIR